jgi:hypothetical protein
MSERDSRKYLEILRGMRPQERLQKAFELGEFTKQLFIQGLRTRFAGVSPEEFQKILRDRLAKRHNSAEKLRIASLCWRGKRTAQPDSGA